MKTISVISVKLTIEDVEDLCYALNNRIEIVGANEKLLNLRGRLEAILTVNGASFQAT
jgi:hypothetical protein